MTLRKSRKILVLGELSTARVLGRHFEASGFEPSFHPLPLDSQNGAKGVGKRDYQLLREVFKRFSEESQAEGLVHPGVTPWAERPELQTLGQEVGLTVVAPSARILSLFDNKLSFLLEAEKLGIDNLVLSYDPLSSIREIQKFIRKNRTPFPFVIKSAKGGGPFGVQVIQSPQSLAQDLPLWFEQLRWNVGEVILFPEKYLEGSRFLTVPFVRFKNGKVQVFPILDSSLQSRHRKIIEFCPPVRVDPAALEKVIRWTKTFADGCGYVGLGTLEFLVDGDRAFIVGGQARLNTSFHLWEEVAGTSALNWQLAALRSEGVRTEETKKSPAPLLPRSEWKTGATLRIYAEDALFRLPQSGWVAEVSTEQKDASFSFNSGDTVSPLHSGLLGLVQVLASSPEELRTSLSEALSETWISGTLQTNERFLEELLNHPWVREGIFHTGFVDEEFLPPVLPSAEYLETFAAVCAWIEGEEEKEAADPSGGPLTLETAEVYGSPECPGRWMVGERWARSSALIRPANWDGQPSRWQKAGFKGLSGRVRIGERPSSRVSATWLGNRWLVRLGNWFMSVRRLGPKSAAAAKASPNRRLVALVSGRVHSVLFRKGVWIGTHEPILLLESLGVFVPHALPMDVKVLEWKIHHDEVVAQGQELAVLEVRRAAPAGKSSSKEGSSSPN